MADVMHNTAYIFCVPWKTGKSVFSPCDMVVNEWVTLTKQLHEFCTTRECSGGHGAHGAKVSQKGRDRNRKVVDPCGMQ